MLIVNADDLGRTRKDTNNILSCFQRRRISSASAMVFMPDSERAAESASAACLEPGLHLNLDLPFSGPHLPPRLEKHHRQVGNYLRAGKWTQVLYNPRLKNGFRYVFDAQYDEYCRLFGREPTQIDGHHHMHLCMNMLMDRIIPRGMRVRRNFTMAKGDKHFVNRIYRRLIDAWLLHRYVCADAFFSIEPVENMHRQERIVRLAYYRNVELMVHPGIQEQYEHLQGHKYSDLIRDVPMGTYNMLSRSPE